MSYTVITSNDGSVWPISDGRWIWRACVGDRILEGAAFTRSEAEKEAVNTKRQMEVERES